MTICVIPTYRARDSVCAVVSSALAVADHVIVVDDACPESSGDAVAQRFAGYVNVEVLRHAKNLGVGGATKTGMRRALELGASVVVKLDADGQMDPAQIPNMVQVLESDRRIAMVKGNRFIDSSVSRVMPGVRLLGNSLLTLCARAATGYWNGIDPTNGYLALRAQSLSKVNFDRLDDRFYFEMSLLAALGLRRKDIAEIDIPAVYGNERSNLSISRALLTFPWKLLKSWLRRILWQYLVADMNVGSLFLIAGTILSLSASTVGALWWHDDLITGTPRSPGTITLVFVPLIMGFQLLLNAILYDVQMSPRVVKVSQEEFGLELVALERQFLLREVV